MTTAQLADTLGALGGEAPSLIDRPDYEVRPAGQSSSLVAGVGVCYSGWFRRVRRALPAWTLSSASIDAARSRFDQAQLSERAHLSAGDAARVPLEPHDWVILDRVICCYPESR